MGLLIGWGQEDRDPLESRLGICRLSVALVQLLLSATDKTVWHALIDKQGKRLVENYAKGVFHEEKHTFATPKYTVSSQHIRILYSTI